MSWILLSIVLGFFCVILWRDSSFWFQQAIHWQESYLRLLEKEVERRAAEDDGESWKRGRKLDEE